MPSNSIYIAANGKTFFFYDWVVFYYVYLCVCIHIYECVCIYIHRYVSSVQSLSCVWLFVLPWTAARQASLSITRACSNSCPSSWWCHPTMSSSVTLFSSCLQSFQASGSFPMSQFFTSGGQGIRGFQLSISSYNENIYLCTLYHLSHQG